MKRISASGSFTIDNDTISVIDCTELEIFMIACFVSALKDSKCTPDMWYAFGCKLAEISPELVEGDSPIIVIDPLNKVSKVYLSAAQLDGYYKGLYSVWEKETNGKVVDIDVNAASSTIDASIVNELKDKIARLEASATPDHSTSQTTP